MAAMAPSSPRLKAAASTTDAPRRRVNDMPEPLDPTPGPEGAPPSGPCCPCGHDRSHFMVSPEPQFSALDWVWVLMGITTIPAEIKFRCRRCGNVFDQTTDEDEMKRYI